MPNRTDRLRARQFSAFGAEDCLLAWRGALHADGSAESHLMASWAMLIHENIVVVTGTIDLLDDFFGKEGEAVPQRTFIILHALQLNLIQLTYEFTVLVMRFKLSLAFQDGLAASILIGAVEGEVGCWYGLNLKDSWASIGTGSFFISGARDTLEAEDLMAWPLASHNICRNIIANGALQLFSHLLISDVGLPLEH